MDELTLRPAWEVERSCTAATGFHCGCGRPLARPSDSGRSTSTSGSSAVGADTVSAPSAGAGTGGAVGDPFWGTGGELDSTGGIGVATGSTGCAPTSSAAGPTSACGAGSDVETEGSAAGAVSRTPVEDSAVSVACGSMPGASVAPDAAGTGSRWDASVGDGVTCSAASAPEAAGD